ERLADWRDDLDPRGKDGYAWNRLRVPLKREQLAAAWGEPAEWRAHLKLGEELLEGGDPLAALDCFASAEQAWQREVGKQKPPIDAAAVARAPEAIELLRWRAVSWLRLGELENCIHHHGCASCVVPIAPAAEHTVRRGSEQALALYLELLARVPDDRDARWLANLAAMTLGKWPDGLPEAVRLQKEQFESRVPFLRFRDVAPQAGLADSSLSGGACIEDFDGDGRLDVMTASLGFDEPFHLYRNQGDGTFVDRAREAGLAGLMGGLNMAHADYDNDGDADVLVLRGAWWGEQGRLPNSLLRNRGDGSFDDVTEEAGLLSFHPTQTAQWRDFDGDGWLDLVIGNETQEDRHRHPCELFRSKRDGTFEEVARAVGADVVGWVKGVAAGDFDGDGRVDLYYSMRNGSNRLLRNESSERAPGFRFADVTTAAGLDEGPKMSFPTWFFDCDQDGDDDLFVSTNAPLVREFAADIGKVMVGEPPLAPTRLFTNEGGRFRDVASESDLGDAILSMGSNFGDFDGDGFEDVYLGNGSPPLDALLPNRMYRNAGGGRFVDVTFAAGTGHLQKGHAVALGDIDEDGDLDLFLETGGFFDGDAYPSVLYENPGHGQRWITLRLRGVKSNRSAIGARVRVVVASPQGERTVHTTIGTGGSFGSSSLQAEIGLGEATAVTLIEIDWPGSANLSRIVPKDSAAMLDHAWLAVEEAGELVEQTLAPFRFAAAGAECCPPPSKPE
ncbi:MAG: VCBS repeat-containing protein, partial [Planctomycetes bacterium]|nr:VCBS repeat-containing protein [Planctomycetota bacterium]